MYAIVDTPNSHQHFRRSVQLAAIEDVLPDQEVHTLCRQLGYAWRNRKLPPGCLVRSMVYRGLSPDRSIAAVLADLASLADDAHGPTDSAWCQASRRLPELVLIEANRRLTRRMRRRFGAKHSDRGRPIFLVDGTGVSMPDTPALAEQFGYTRSKQYASRFPVARVTVIGLAGVNAIWDCRIGEYRCSEDEQFHHMWHTIPSGAICLFDRYFSSFYNLAKLRQRRIAVVSRLHQRRDPQRLIRQGRRLGPHEWLVPLELSPQLRRRYDDPTLPQHLWLRLIRVDFRRGRQRHRHWLVTTLADRHRYRRQDVADMYRRRWEIETRLGEIKTALQADVLHSKTPAGVRRELLAILLGHNVVWWLIHLAAQHNRTPSETISFAGAAKTILAFSHELAHAHGKHRRDLFDAMLRHIARQTNHHPRHRVEPRLIKRDPVRYGILRTNRQDARLKCLT
jgi:hypothetical protein